MKRIFTKVDGWKVLLCKSRWSGSKNSVLWYGASRLFLPKFHVYFEPQIVKFDSRYFVKLPFEPGNRFKVGLSTIYKPEPEKMDTIYLSNFTIFKREIWVKTAYWPYSIAGKTFLGDHLYPRTLLLAVWIPRRTPVCIVDTGQLEFMSLNNLS